MAAKVEETFLHGVFRMEHVVEERRARLGSVFCQSWEDSVQKGPTGVAP